MALGLGSLLHKRPALLFEMCVPAFDGDAAFAGGFDRRVIMLQAGQMLDVPKGQFANGVLLVFQPVDEHVRRRGVLRVVVVEAPQ